MATPPDPRSEFKALVDELESLPAEGPRRAQIEQRLIALLTKEIPGHERRTHVRLPCALAVTVVFAGRREPGTVIDVGTGGVCLSAKPGVPMPGPATEPELDGGVVVHGRAAWIADDRRPGGLRGGIGVAFVASDAPAEQRVRAFVIQLLRQRAP